MQSTHYTQLSIIRSKNMYMYTRLHVFEILALVSKRPKTCMCQLSSLVIFSAWSWFSNEKDPVPDFSWPAKRQHHTPSKETTSHSLQDDRLLEKNTSRLKSQFPVFKENSIKIRKKAIIITTEILF